MATVSGAMTTTNVLSDQLAIDLGDTIKLLEADINPLSLFSSRAGKAATVATKFSWMEEQSKVRFVQQSGGPTNVATTIPLVAGRGAMVPR